MSQLGNRRTEDFVDGSVMDPSGVALPPGSTMSADGVEYKPNESVSDALDARLPEVDGYATIRSGTLESSAVSVTGQYSGTFRVDESDTTSLDDGGTILVDDANGKRWKRDIDDHINVLCGRDPTIKVKVTILQHSPKSENILQVSKIRRSVYFRPGIINTQHHQIGPSKMLVMHLSATFY